MLTELQMSASREAYRATVAKHSETIELIHEKYMEVVKTICQQHDNGELSGANAKTKVGLATAKQKRLIKNLIGEPSVITYDSEQHGRSKTNSSFVVNAVTTKILMSQLSENINSIFATEPHASVIVSVEICADFPEGVSSAFILSGDEKTTSSWV